MADSAYLKSAVGPVLAAGIAQTVSERPDDPIEFLAQYLLKSVADEKQNTILTASKKQASAASDAAKSASEKKSEADKARAEALAVQTDKEDKRLETLLENATSSEEVFSAVLSYARARTGASGYVMLTDLPEKVVPPKPVEAPAAEGGGEEAAAEGEGGEEVAPVEEAAEEAEPPPKFKPSELLYVAATSSDEALLLGKKLQRPPAPAEDGEEEAAPTGVGEGISFTAIDDYLSSGAKVLHEPKAVENRSVKFWYLPRIGAYACAPFEDFEGDVSGAFGFDTLGLERAFTASELALLESLAAKTGTHLQRIEAALCEVHHAEAAKLAEAYPKDAETGAFPAAPACEEGGDAIEAAKAAVALPGAVLGALTAESLKFTETRKSIPASLLLVLKGVLSLLSPGADLAAATWDGVKGAIMTGSAVWADDFPSAISNFDVLAGAGEGGWDAATAMLTELTTAPEDGEPPVNGLADASLLGKVLFDWLAATCALHDLKLQKDAEAAAAAAAGEGEGEAAEEPAADEPVE